MRGDQGLDYVGGNKGGDKGTLYNGRISKNLEPEKREREESKNFQPDVVRCCHYQKL